MDPITLLIIVTIIALILVHDFYKRQNAKITNNLHTDNLKQLLTISALEYKFSAELHTETEPQSTVNEITHLISSYEKGEIPTEVFHNRMDCVLNKYN